MNDELFSRETGSFITSFHKFHYEFPVFRVYSKKKWSAMEIISECTPTNYIYTYTLNTDNIGKKYVRTCTRVRTHGTFRYSSVSSVICMGEIRI